MDKEEIIKSINALFGDTSVSPAETRRDLEEIKELCDELIATLPEDE